MNEEFYKQNTLTDLTSLKEQRPSIPHKIGPYKIESLLSKGGMSLLYLGIHPETKQTLVIKVLSPEFVTHPEMIERFLKEAKIIGMTNHPNIVKLYGQGQWEGGLYIVMEFIRGVSLRQFIVQQSLSLKRSIDIILQVAYALCHLHAHQVIHGDLKPENILITEDGEVKVIDFGIARLHDEVKKIGTRIIGTPNYMSPEQKEDPSKMSYASDIYSLGVIAYELAMGKLSFGVIHLSLLPKGFKKIIEKALSISVEERYPDSIAFIADLSQYLKSGGLEKDRPGSDQLKEVLEVIQMTTLSLSPSILPHWAQMEMGLVRYKAPGQTGSYHDFFKFPDNSYGILIAETATTGIESSIYTAFFRGIFKALIATSSRPFQLQNFISTLNGLIKEDSINQKFSLVFLLLNPLKGELLFISCGLGGVIHLSSDSHTPRKLTNKNSLIGLDLHAEFFVTTDNWEVGDVLIFHSLDSSLEAPLMEAVSENLFLSAQGQAEALLKRVSSSPSFPLQKSPKVLMTLQRIG